MPKLWKLGLPVVFCTLVLLAIAGPTPAQKKSYDLFETPRRCAQCHREIFTEWRSAMMSQAYTHPWDEIEYFKLAVPQADRDPKVAEVKAGCNGCHAPAALFIGDTPPPLPSAGSRANEAVSCDICHIIPGFEGELPFNYNYILKPGKLKYGQRPGAVSPHHDTQTSDFIQSPEFCGTCHNEKNPYGIWVKIHPARVQGRPLREAGRPLPGLPHVACPREERRHGRARSRTWPITTSPADTSRPSSGA